MQTATYTLYPNRFGGYEDGHGREFSKSEARWLREIGKAVIVPAPTTGKAVA